MRVNFERSIKKLFPGNGGGYIAEMFFEGEGKMREVFKAHFEVNIHRLPGIGGELIMCQLQSFPRQPFLRRGLKGLPEVAVKS